MSGPKTPAFVIEAFVSSNWHAKRQSTSVVKPDVRFQIVKTRASSNRQQLQFHSTRSIRLHVRLRLRVRIKLSCKACNSRRECGFSPRSRHRSRRRFEYIMFNSVFYIFDKTSLDVFRKRVFSFHRYIWNCIYFIENTPVVIQDQTSTFQLTVFSVLL